MSTAASPLLSECLNQNDRCFLMPCKPASEQADICDKSPCLGRRDGSFEVFGQLRQRPSHANMRSTTHRRGRTSKPLALSERLMVMSRCFTEARRDIRRRTYAVVPVTDFHSFGPRHHRDGFDDVTALRRPQCAKVGLQRSTKENGHVACMISPATSDRRQGT